MSNKFYRYLFIFLNICFLCYGQTNTDFIDPYLLFGNENITCESTLDTSSGALEFFNGCLKDTTEIRFWGAIGAQILEWFNQDLYLQYVTSFLFFLPFVAFNEKRELETQAKANRLRCFLVLLLFRMGLAASSASWFQALFQQNRPCECSTDPSTIPYEQLGSVWGMPSADMMVTSVVGFFFLQYVSKLLGITLIILVAYSRIILGFDSVGQVFAGFIIALVLHIYHIGSPIFMRLIDVVINFIGGMCTFILVKRDYMDTNFNFAVLYLNGMAWMIYGLALFFLYYDFYMLKTIWNSPSHFMTDETFLYYTPVREGSLGSTSFAPQRKFETLFFIILTILLFFTLIAFRVLTPYIDQALYNIWA